MTDAVRKALDAAEIALRENFVRGMSTYRDDAADAIAAFLQALSDTPVRYPPPEWSTGWRGTADTGRVHSVAPEHLAAAVKRAALEPQT